MGCIENRASRSSRGRVGAWNASSVASLAVLAASLLLVPFSATAADDLESASYRHRAGRFVSTHAAGSAGLTSSAIPARFSGTQITVGVPAAPQPTGSAASLRSVLSGFWSIVAGVFPMLDLDGDGEQFFLDTDDDGDGLADGVETGTGVFVSQTDTGTSPLDSDSDDDGFRDDVEIAAGTDPTDPASRPDAPGVPAGGPFNRVLLLLGLVLLGCSVGVRAPRRGVPVEESAC